MEQVHRLAELNPRKILIVRVLRGLGDLLTIIPALRALRAGLPGAEITLLCLPWARNFIKRYPQYFDDFIEFVGWPSIPELPVNIAILPAFLEQVHARKFDLAIQMQGSGLYSNQFVVMLGAKRNAGFYLPGLYCPDKELFLAHPADEPEVRRFLRLMEHLGLPLQGEQLEFPVYDSDREALAQLPEARQLQAENYVVLHPGANEKRRRWPPENFAAVGDALARQGYQVVLTGIEEEIPDVQAVAQAMTAPVVNFAGKTTLGSVAALIEGARMVVSNDTGIAHLTDALRRPSITLFFASNPNRWGALDRKLHRALGQYGLGWRDEVPEVLLPQNGHAPANNTGPFHDLFTLNGRCLRDACMRFQPIDLDQPKPVTPDMVLNEAADLLAQIEGAHDR